MESHIMFLDKKMLLHKQGKFFLYQCFNSWFQSPYGKTNKMNRAENSEKRTAMKSNYQVVKRPIKKQCGPGAWTVFIQTMQK